MNQHHPPDWGHSQAYAFDPLPPNPPAGVAFQIARGVVVNAFIALAGGAVLLLSARESGPSYATWRRETVVIDDVKQLASGVSSTWKIPSGRYQLAVTATGKGAFVTWTGAACQGAKEAPVFNGDCTLSQDGQLTIGNPTRLGLGVPIDVTVKLTRLP